MSKSNSPNAAVEAESPATASERIARLLALFLVKGMPAGEAIMKLDVVGFSPADIARLLETSTNNVAVTKFNARNAAKKKKKKKA
jgi:DNA-directed RNA polymerase specialized sigma24 family protein